ncbi:MAG TPA: RluA family pseudouridine synthase [Polyangiaceae bacterium]|jgi:23S rRNA pseudouridine1911/1915/1917 synthase|nr:RluA family pseudouridine synthase [Polyangiaceae bacterium]
MPSDISHRITPAQQGTALDRLLRELCPGKSWNEVRRLVKSGKVSVDGKTVLEPTLRLNAGAEVALRMSAPRPGRPGALDPGVIVYADTHLVVVRKPPGISTVPYEEDETGTLDELVRVLLKRRTGPEGPLRIVHRLDKETSGLIMFARSLSAQRELKQQFRVHSVRRRYLALAHGNVPGATHKSRLLRDRGDGVRGSTRHRELGREAITHVKVVERLSGATYIECQLETGRTHQIRIHLSEAGHPLLGERLYVRGYPGPIIAAPRLMLHARELGFRHPITGQTLLFEEPLPEDMARMLEQLRQQRR